MSSSSLLSSSSSSRQADRDAQRGSRNY